VEWALPAVSGCICASRILRVNTASSSLPSPACFDSYQSCASVISARASGRMISRRFTLTVSHQGSSALLPTNTPRLDWQDTQRSAYPARGHALQTAEARKDRPEDFLATARRVLSGRLRRGIEHREECFRRPCDQLIKPFQDTQRFIDLSRSEIVNPSASPPAPSQSHSPIHRVSQAPSSPLPAHLPGSFGRFPDR
jgi:hypothetical protein